QRMCTGCCVKDASGAEMAWNARHQSGSGVRVGGGGGGGSVGPVVGGATCARGVQVAGRACSASAFERSSPASSSVGAGVQVAGATGSPGAVAVGGAGGLVAVFGVSFSPPHAAINSASPIAHNHPNLRITPSPRSQRAP